MDLSIGQHLTVGQLRKLIEGVPDDTVVAVQDPGDQSEAFFLIDAGVDMWDDALVLVHESIVWMRSEDATD